MVTTALVFDHRARVKSNKEGPIEVRVTIDGKSYYVSTGVKCLKKHFQLGMVVDRYDCDVLNERLLLIKSKIDKEVNRCMKEGCELNLSLMRQNLLSLDCNGKKNDFIEFAQNSLEMMPTSEGRKEHYITLITRLIEFDVITGFADLTVENIYKFDAWLHKLKKPVGDEYIMQSTIYNYHKNLKALINFGIKLGTISDNPYERLKGVFSRGERASIEYLTEDEMRRIEYLHLLPGEMATARDLFILQMYTGLSYSDMQNLNLDNYKLIEGKWMYNGERIKTGVAYVSHLLSPVVRVLESYGWRVPKMAMQHYNEQLKIIGKAAGISTRMHSHLARHTFATYMLRNGVKPENLQRMLGHQRITQSLHYAKVLAASVHEDFDMIERKLNHSNHNIINHSNTK